MANVAPAGLTALVTDSAVPADLAHLVAGAWVLGGGTVPRALPHPAVDLLVMPDGRCLLTGPETRGRQGPLPEGGSLVGVRLRPGVVTGLFGVPADEVPLSGVPVEAGHLPGTARARLAGALRLVRERAGRCRVDQRVRAVLAAMHAAPGVPVAGHAAAVGLRPKSYVRVVRLHQALAAARVALAAGERPQWADIALRSGFYDQSHLLAEFRDAVGVPPNTLLRPFSPSGGGPGLTRSRHGR